MIEHEREGKAKMDHGKVVRQSWNNVLHFRALWVFGFILALTTVSWGTVLLLDGDDNAGEPRVGLTIDVQPGENFREALGRTFSEELDEVRDAIDQANGDLDRFFATELDVEIESDILFAIALVASIMLAIFIIAKIARYVAEVSLIRMVNEHQDTGQRSGVLQGLRMGWSQAAWRLFLIDVVINTPLALGFLLLFALALSPLLLWADGQVVAGALGTVAAVGLVFLVIGLAVLVGAALSVLKPIMRRVCVLEDQGVIASIGRGWRALRRHFGDFGLTWLITFVVNFTWPFVVIPVVLVLVGVGIVVGGASAVLAGGLVAQVFEGAAPWIAAVATGVILFLLVLIAPLTFLGGLREVFVSSAWTLTYHDLRPSESMASLNATNLDASGLEAASLA
jgi:hypothetical protein